MPIRILSLMILLPVLGAAQAGWTRPKGTGYARFTIGTIGSSSFFTPLGDVISSAQYRDVSASFYGEYGITNDWTAVVYFPFLRNHRLETTSSLTNAGDAMVGFRRRLVRGRTPVALAVDFGLPTGDAQGRVSIRDLPDGEFRLPTGDGEFNTRVSLFASRASREAKPRVGGGGGKTTRPRVSPDESFFWVGGGRRISPAVSISGTLAGLAPARAANFSRAVGFGVGEGVEFVTVGGEAQYRITKRHSVSAGYYKPLRGKNLLAGGSLVFGFGINF